MILLEVDCSHVDNEIEFCRLLRDKITEINHCYTNCSEKLYFQDCNNFNAFWDDITEYNFNDYPTKMVLYNLYKVKQLCVNLNAYNGILDIFKRLHEQYEDDLIVELYEHEIEKPTECVTLKFVKLDKEYGNEEEQRNYEANCNE